MNRLEYRGLFVDEALTTSSTEILFKIIRRDLSVSFWGIFDSENLLHLIRPIIVKGRTDYGDWWIEVADERLLKLMNKGVSLPQVIQCTRAFKDAGA